jgi:DNA end-binding protein Ku
VPESDVVEEERVRSFWSGTLSFGLVSIPVTLLPAQRSTRGALRLVDAEGTPLARRYYSPENEKEIDTDQLVRGQEIKNKVVVVTDEELAALAPKKSREIELVQFVDRDELDPIYFDRSYFLAPGRGAGKAYRLLSSVMERSRRAGIATFVMREKEYLVAIFAEGGLLRAEILRFHDAVRTPRTVGLRGDKKRVSTAAKKKVARAVSALTKNKWKPSALPDPHAAIRKLAERKYKRGQDVTRAAPTREANHDVVDILALLRESLAKNDLKAKASNGEASGKKPSKARARARPKAAVKSRTRQRRAA